MISHPDRDTRPSGYYWVLPDDDNWQILEWVEYPDKEDSGWYPKRYELYEGTVPWDESIFLEMVGPIVAPPEVKPIEADVAALKDIIYKYFYNGPIAGASARLSRIIHNHLLGLPLLTFDEVLNEFLMSHMPDDFELKDSRAAFWRGVNLAEGGDPEIILRLEEYIGRKEYDFVKPNIAMLYLRQEERRFSLSEGV